MNESNDNWKKVDLSKFDNSWYKPGRGVVVQMLWRIFGRPAVRFLPTHVGHPKLWSKVRAGLLRLFGAKVGSDVVIRDCDIYFPWNVEIGDNVWLGSGANIYSLVKITLGDNVVVSQDAMLCTGSHDLEDPKFGLIVGEINLKTASWACARCFIGPNVTLNEGSVAAAGSVVVNDLPEMTICGGNPAKPIKKREIKE